MSERSTRTRISLQYGLVFSEQEWNEEWKSLLRLSSAEPRISQTKPSGSSEQIPPSDESVIMFRLQSINGSLSSLFPDSIHRNRQQLKHRPIPVVRPNCPANPLGNTTRVSKSCTSMSWRIIFVGRSLFTPTQYSGRMMAKPFPPSSSVASISH